MYLILKKFASSSTGMILIVWKKDNAINKFEMAFVWKVNSSYIYIDKNKPYQNYSISTTNYIHNKYCINICLCFVFVHSSSEWDFKCLGEFKTGQNCLQE